MARHPFANVAIAGAFNTPQARRLDGHDSLSITMEAARGVIDATGLDPTDIDGVIGPLAPEVIYQLGLGPTLKDRGGAIAGVIHAAALVATGVCTTVLMPDGGAGVYTDRSSTAPWTRPVNEFVASPGLYTAAEFALIARRHMELCGTTPEQLTLVAATIRNYGHINPEAVYHDRGPFTPSDILASRMIADPFHLLDCSTNSEGGCALVITTAARVADLALAPVYVLGAGMDQLGPGYRHPPSWNVGTDDENVNGYVGRRAAAASFKMAGLEPHDVDVCEFYDPFSFELIRQFEAFGFCEPGEGGPFVESGVMAPDGRFPTTTDGGTMSFSHAGGLNQMLQRVVRGVHQLQGRASGHQVAQAEVALCSNGGAGALFNDVILLGSGTP